MKNTGKKTVIAAFVMLLMSVVLFSCKKETGPTGATGAAGKDGNANVVMYKFGSFDFSTNDFAQSITMSQDSFDNMVWLAYIKYNSTNTYSVPGFGYGGTTNYRFYTYNATATLHEFDIAKVSGTGEAYDDVKIVGIGISKIIGKKSSLPDIDFSNYNVVKAYYGLKD